MLSFTNNNLQWINNTSSVENNTSSKLKIINNRKSYQSSQYEMRKELLLTARHQLLLIFTFHQYFGSAKYFDIKNQKVENRKWGFKDKNDHFCHQNRFNPPSSFLQSSLDLNHHLSTDQVSQIIHPISTYIKFAMWNP